MDIKTNYIITLTGDLGSGKGSVSQILKERYGFLTYSTGDIQRQIAKSYNMTTLELNQYAETHSEIDDEIDSIFTSLSDSTEDIIIDSRMAWHFIPKSFKVYLKVDIDIAAERIMGANRGETESYSTIEEAKIMVAQRKASENKRYKIKYNVDCKDLNNFDLVVDSSYISSEEVAELIMNEAKIYFKNNK